ncbi:GDSL-type esterase/lipase family protein [Flammeovirgaceae bacterium SG7u.111]|nr:GDSL-type esterase/lipase family protein [Flammeovirgaceae bacterium SG7u.132]WPO37752.1 GDSL-type esterase/lipase family protein [Flammeovirgaceae bacterium SG7u.111]
MIKVKKVLFLVWIVSAQLAWGQDMAQPEAYGIDSMSASALEMKYDFVRYDLNQLQLFHADALSHYFEKAQRLQRTNDTKLSILHIGDSHIQADIFSGKVRNDFNSDSRFNLNARGLVFPYRAARTNTPYNYKSYYTGRWENMRAVKSKHRSEWGLTAITVLTNSTASTVTIKPNDGEQKYLITKVKIFYPNHDKNQFVPYIPIDEDNYITSYFTGDGFVEYTFDKPLNEVKLQLQKTADNQTEFLLQGMTLENMEPGMTYHSTGLNGAEVDTYLRCKDFARQVKVIKPDLVIISLGTNDAYMYTFNSSLFKMKYKRLLAQVSEAAPRASIILTTPGDGYRRRRYPNKNNEKAAEAIMEVANDLNLAVWNFYEVMGGYQSVNTWYKNGLSQRDKLHFTTKGYNLQGDLFYESLDRTYRQWQSGVYGQ